MSNLKNKLQHLVEGQIPEYLRVSYPRFAAFIKEYYTFLDGNRQANAMLLNSNTWSDVDLTLDMFVDEMRKQHAYDISPEALVEQRRLIKFINQYYESKGTENAAELYFRMMYNDTATIKYPGDYVLRASDGVWQSKKTIKIDTDYNQINPDSLALAPAPLRSSADDVYDLKEKTIYLKYHRRESSGLNLYAHEIGCVQVGRVITNNDIFELEVDIPRTVNINDFNKALATLSYFDTVWVTAFENGVEYVYGFLTQQLVGYDILSGGENFRRRDTFTVEVAESPLYPIPGQENNNGIIRVTNVTTRDVEEYFGSDYVLAGAEYAASDTSGIINDFRFISTGHRFDITGDYFAELYNEDDDYTTYKDFTRVFENPRKNRYTTLVTGDYFEEREGFPAYMEFNDDRGYTDFNETIYNLSTATVRFEVGYVYEHPGKWKNNAGFLSDINKLQDNYYYQAYSYVVQTKNVPYETWSTLYKNSTHPAGFIVFGELLVENEINFTPINITSTQYIVNNFIENIQPVDAIGKDVSKPVEDEVTVGNSYAPEYFAELYTEGEVVYYDFNKVLDDSITISDLTGLSLNTQPVFGDTVNTSEELTKNVTLSDISDVVTILDSALVEITYNREFSDSFNVADEQVISAGPNFGEIVYSEDTLNFSAAKLLENEVVSNDVAIKDMSLVFDFIETYSPQYFAEDYASENVVSIGDTVAIKPNYGLIENSEVTDETISSFGKNVSEELQIVEETALVIDKTFTDVVLATDENSINFEVTYTELVNTEDSTLPVFTIPEQDATSVTDTATSNFNKQISETLEVDDVKALTLTQQKTESVGVEDSSNVLVSLTKTESVNIDETITSAITKPLNETINIDDVLNIAKTYVINDTVTQQDTRINDVDKVIVSAYSETYFECQSYAGDDLITLTDTILVAVDNYVATAYVDDGYAGEVATNTDVTNQC